MGITATLGALALFTLGYALWQWRADWILTHQPMQQTQTLANTDMAADMIAALPDEHLFGKALGSGDVPVTQLQFRVTGIVKINTAQGNTQSKAYISISGQPSKIYQMGDSLPYGVKVYDILPNAVILENEGRLEKLPLPRQQLEFKPRNTEERV